MTDIDWWITEATEADIFNGPGDGLEHVEVIADALAPCLAGAGRFALDLGCGWGRLLVPMAARFPRALFWGCDVAPRHHGHRWPRNACWLATDGYGLMLAEEVVDAAWSVLLFQHLPDDEMAVWLIEMSRVLKDGGRFCFQWVDEDAPDAPRLYQHSEEFVRAAVDDAGFSILHWDVNPVGPSGWWWATAIWP